MIRMTSIAALTLALTVAASAEVTYDFTGKAGVFDNETSVDVSVSDGDTGNTTTMTVNAIGGELNSNAGDLGIDDDVEPASTSDKIDGTDEGITLSFDKDVELVVIDLGSVGSDATEGALLTIDAFDITLHTGVSGFNGTSDTYTPGSPIAISAGTPIQLTGSAATSSFDLEAITLNVIPEPASLALLGLGGLALIRRRA